VDDGTQVQNAPLYFVSPTQINAQLPYIAPGTVAVRVRNANGVSGDDRISLVDSAPELYTSSSGDPLLFHPDFSLVSGDAPANAGETLVAYVNGLGFVDPPIDAGVAAGDGGNGGPLEIARLQPFAFIGGQPGDVQFAGLAPGMAGLFQVNFTVPVGLDDGNYEVAFAVGAQKSQPNVKAPVRNPKKPQQYWVAPDGTPSGDGSKAKPWDLNTALAPAAAVQPGDTIWLRGGTYGDGSTTFSSYLAGSAQRPVTLRQAPGERATINGGLAVYGAYTWYWGFEVTNTQTNRGADRNVPECVDTYDGSTGVRLINLVLHDCNQGIGFWLPTVGGEAYGNLIYHNGWQGTDRGHGHGIYTQNENGTKRILDNIIFNQFGLGIQAYGSNKAFVQGYDVEGNIVFNNGSISTGATNVDNMLFGVGVPMKNILLQNNYTYHTPDTNKGYSRVGWDQTQVVNDSVVVRNNYWIGGQSAVELWNWTKATFMGNTCYSNNGLSANLSLAPDGTTAGYQWNRNTYYGAEKFRFNGGQNQNWTGWLKATGMDASSRFVSGRPTGVWTFVRPNKYEQGRANIVIYNWDMQDSVKVSLSGVLKPGTAYEVRDAENFFAGPVASGTFDGSPVTVPMKGLTVVAPVGDVPAAPQHTAPQFGVFVVLPR
jgi:uncharacterized protein (TIGR03437 family)